MRKNHLLKLGTEDVSCCVKNLKLESSPPLPLNGSNYGCVKKELEPKKVGIMAPQSKVSLRV